MFIQVWLATPTWVLWLTSGLCPAFLRNPDPAWGRQSRAGESLGGHGCCPDPTATTSGCASSTLKETSVDYNGNTPLWKEAKLCLWSETKLPQPAGLGTADWGLDLGARLMTTLLFPVPKQQNGDLHCRIFGTLLCTFGSSVPLLTSRLLFPDWEVGGKHCPAPSGPSCQQFVACLTDYAGRHLHSPGDRRGTLGRSQN